MTIAQPPVGDNLRERKKQHTRRAIHESALELVDENGLDGTTIEQICQRADVSQRTFFNYYPSKGAAALGLPETAISPETIAQFRQATGDLVPALCELVGEPADERLDRIRLKEVIHRRPELMPAFSQWMSGVREQFVQLAEERSGSRETALLAVTLVMAAFGLVVHDQSQNDAPAVDRLKEAVDRIAGVRTVKMVPPK
ncbi:TetR/AcrR family transcriptional regulator [Humibacter ginsenosidimutans]|uniref:TetR family transcriptional regulator n=1 Tax=Humibacter ginsenosidimutans TaxID=2599293 RepID=A0A5B8M3J1_9MICO|nr:TetR/AcrR family transcriptional regulator [Humibacter ginsenosidimutans]QDZ14160.1 TetR family transcriptional regulator [Humibacter ginsenosidimutans]